MRRHALTFTIAAVALLVAPSVQAEEGGYIGLGYGQSTFNVDVDVDAVVSQTYQEADLRLVQEQRRLVGGDDKDTAWKFFGGYNFNKYFAAEAAYANLGQAAATIVTEDISAISSHPTGVDGEWRGSSRTDLSLRAHGVSIAARGNLPVTSFFSVFAKVGGFYYGTELGRGWEVNGSQFVDEWLPDDRSFEDTVTDSGFTWMYGVGLGFDFAERWGVNLEYESYQDIEYSVGKDNINMTSFSVEYRF